MQRMPNYLNHGFWRYTNIVDPFYAGVLCAGIAVGFVVVLSWSLIVAHALFICLFIFHYSYEYNNIKLMGSDEGVDDYSVFTWPVRSQVKIFGLLSGGALVLLIAEVMHHIL